MTRHRLFIVLLSTLAMHAMLYGQQLIALPIIVKTAGQEVYGAYMLLFTLANLLLGLAPLGIGFRYRRQLPATDNADERRALFVPQALFSGGMLAVLALAAIIALPLADRTIGLGTKLDTVMLALPALLAAQFVYGQALDYYRYRGQFHRFNLAAAAVPYLYVGGLAALALSDVTLTAGRLMAVQAAAFGLVALPLLMGVLPEIVGPLPRLSLAQMREDIRLGFPLTVEFTVDFVLSAADRYVIALYMTVGAVGAYVAGYQVGMVIIMLAKVGGVMLPTLLSRLVDMGERAQAQKLLDTFLRLFLTLALPFAVGCLFLGPPLLALLTTPEVAEQARWVTPIVAVGAIFYGLGLLLGVAAFVERKTKAILTANATAGALNLILNLAIYAVFADIHVAAATTLISYAAGYLYLRRRMRDVWPARVGAAAVLRIMGASLAMAVALAAAGWSPTAPPETTVSGFLGGVGIGIVSYLVSLVLIGGASREDLRLLRDLRTGTGIQREGETS